MVLLPGKGSGAPQPSARVSLANLDDADYAGIDRDVRATMDRYFAEYMKGESDGGVG